MLELNKIYQGDWIELSEKLDDNSVDLIITSPPYWGLRDYNVDGQLGLESHPNEYINKLVKGFSILKNKLKKTGSCYINMGDTYFGSGAGTWNNSDLSNLKEVYAMQRIQSKVEANKLRSNWLKPKQLMLMPARLAIALQESGWILRNTIIWHKSNSMPSSVKDRLNNTYEHIFHFVKSRKYYYDLNSIREEHKSESLERVKRPWDGHREPLSSYVDMDISKMCHPSGKNPGDVYTGKMLCSPESYNSPAARKAREGYNAEEHFYSPLGKNPGDYWNINTKPFPEAHFAVFPPNILIKPIKSSCANEVCKKCGTPRFPISEPAEEYAKRLGKSWHNHKDDNIRGQRYDRSIAGKPCSSAYKTTGYTSCPCNEGFKPPVILDPFMGSGTVAMVCKYAGKFGIKKKINWIGFELNPEYINIANKRISQSLLSEQLSI